MVARGGSVRKGCGTRPDGPVCILVKAKTFRKNYGSSYGIRIAVRVSLRGSIDCWPVFPFSAGGGLRELGFRHSEYNRRRIGTSTSEGDVGWLG